MKRKKYIYIIIICICIINLFGCSQKKEYVSEYNFETDYQYSYDCSVSGMRNIQSDGEGQFITVDNYLYYHNNATDEIALLCSKINCLHNQETDSERKADCNAYVGGCVSDEEVINTCDAIQYYDGNIYYVNGNCLYRVSKDGSDKDKIFKTDDELPINDWIIHRGVFYYQVQPYINEEGVDTYAKYIIKAIEISNVMKENKAEILFETNDELDAIGFSSFNAYKDYVSFGYLANSKGKTTSSNKEWVSNVISGFYILDTKNNKLTLLETPEGYTNTTKVSGIAFLEDKILIKLYENAEDENYKLPIYCVDYNMNNWQIWKEDISQGYELQAYNNYAILQNSGAIENIGNKKAVSNYMIYDDSGKLVTEYTCPTFGAVGLCGVGPDGKQVLFEDDESETDIYILDVDEMISSKKKEAVPRKVDGI